MKIQIQIKIRKNAFTSPGSCLHEEQANALWSRREAASSPQTLSRVVGFLSQQIPGVASAPQKRSKKGTHQIDLHLSDRLLGVGQYLDHPAEARPLPHSLPHLQKKSVRKNFFTASPTFSITLAALAHFSRSVLRRARYLRAADWTRTILLYWVLNSSAKYSLW